MKKPKVGCVGGGVVGQAMQKLCGPETVVYDPFVKEHTGTKQDIGTCDVCFVNVPTPMVADESRPDFGACDTSIVEEVVDWIESDLIIIRSTVAPGTTDRLIEKTGKRIVFQPEYLGETPAHIFVDMGTRPFAVLGGKPGDTSAAADFYKHYYNAYMQYYFCDAMTAEVCKYMENAFYAVKVTFVNEFHDIAKAHGIDFNVLREMWLADTRISRDHTFVYPEGRGFSGKCLPKDCNAIVHSSRKRGYEPELMAATLRINDQFQARNK